MPVQIINYLINEIPKSGTKTNDVMHIAQHTFKKSVNSTVGSSHFAAAVIASAALR